MYGSLFLRGLFAFLVVFVLCVWLGQSALAAENTEHLHIEQVEEKLRVEDRYRQQAQQKDYRDGQIYDEEELLPPYERYAAAPTPPCCATPTVDNINYLIISTMDGKLQALDILNGGEAAWQMDLDNQPLMWGTLGKVQPLISPEGEMYELVPSLDGSLFKYSETQRLLEPIPLNADMLLQASLKIGHDAIAGGRTVTTTGICPMTGKIRYHCNTANCDSSTSEEPEIQATLVFRRSTSTIRAVNALSGAERWNLSVSEYEAHLVLIAQSTVLEKRSLVTFHIRPPEGIITAFNSCGDKMWTRKLGKHIAKTWHLEAGQLNEVSILDDSREAPSYEDFDGEGHQIAKQETMFYLGTLNDDPFIIQSPRSRQELKRLLTGIEMERMTERGRHQLMNLNPVAYQMHIALDDILGPRSTRRQEQLLREKRNNDEARDANSNKQIAIMQERHLAVVQNPRHQQNGKDTVSRGSACPNSDGIYFDEQQDIRNAALEISEIGDQGWYIMRPSQDERVTGSNSWFGIHHRPGILFRQCGANRFSEKMKQALRLDESVSGWWRVIALGLSGFVMAICVCTFIVKKHIIAKKHKKAEELLRQLSDKSRKSIETKTTSCGPSIRERCSPSPVGSLERSRTRTGSGSTPAMLGQERKSGESANSIVAPEMDYESKFLHEFQPVKLLGHGGFGLVFEAINHLDTVHYAIKRIAVANNENDIERVLREVRAMAQLDHPHIIRYYHPWIEKPPPGWQEQKDKELLRKIAPRERRRQLREDHNELNGSSITRRSSDKGNLGVVCQAGLHNGKGEDSELNFNVREPSTKETLDPEDSWNCPPPSDDESSSSSSTSEGELAQPAVKTHIEDSESIIFERSREIGSSHLSKEPTTSDQADPAAAGDDFKSEDDIMLITSRDHHEDVIPAAKKTNADVAYVFIQMQLCQENTLHSWLLRHISPEDRQLPRMKRWMLQLCSAVEYIHSQKLIHRDIKPQNIFFGSDGTLKIGDLGLVTRNVSAVSALSSYNIDESNNTTELDANLTNQVGTKVYMSPEMLAQKPYTFKVDVFSLGLVYCELAMPFTTVSERIVTLEALQTGRGCAALRSQPDEEKFVLWLTHQNPEERPSCSEILDCDYLADAEIPRNNESFRRQRTTNSTNSLSVSFE